MTRQTYSPAPPPLPISTWRHLPVLIGLAVAFVVAAVVVGVVALRVAARNQVPPRPVAARPTPLVVPARPAPTPTPPTPAAVAPRPAPAVVLAPKPAPPTSPAVDPRREYLSPTTVQRVGDVEVRITGVWLGKLPLESAIDGGARKSENALFAVDLTLTNTSTTRKADYQSWSGGIVSFGDAAVLTDDIGNVYKRVGFGFTMEPKNGAKDGSIYPLKSMTDVLVFEAPVDPAKTFYLEMPAVNAGGKEKEALRWRITRSAVQPR